ncbi:MAG: hypothetical protein ACOYK9_01530 [Chlamydiia bacterium]
MNFKKYEDYFHDGSLSNIQTLGQDINLYITSAEMDPDDFEEGFNLVQGDRLKGVLKLENVYKIVVNKKIHEGDLRLISEHAGIMNLEIHEGKVVLAISWAKYSDRNFHDFTVNEIFCENAVFYIDERVGEDSLEE